MLSDAAEPVTRNPKPLNVSWKTFKETFIEPLQQPLALKKSLKAFLREPLPLVCFQACLRKLPR